MQDSLKNKHINLFKEFGKHHPAIVTSRKNWRAVRLLTRAESPKTVPLS